MKSIDQNVQIIRFAKLFAVFHVSSVKLIFGSFISLLSGINYLGSICFKNLFANYHLLNS